MTSTLLMFDDTDVSLLPSGYDAYAAYIDGIYANYTQVRAKFPTAQILSIDVNATNTSAMCLDVEPGDATNAQAVTWVKAKVAAKDSPIVVYTSVSNVNALVSALAVAGVARSEYKIWSAHYGDGAHICGPATCDLCSTACDGTQFTDTALGDSLDESVIEDNFFGSVVINPPATDPTLMEGDTGAAVGTLQGRLNVWQPTVKTYAELEVDEDFGPLTETAVEDFQTYEKITVDGVVGPETWGKLNAAPPAPKTEVTVPDVIGRTDLATAEGIIKAAGLVAKAVGDSAVGNHGEVTAQSPAAGTKVESGSTVTLTYTVYVEVPGLLGRTDLATVDTLVKDAGLSIAKTGKVTAQSPKAGTKVPKGTTVTVTYTV